MYKLLAFALVAAVSCNDLIEGPAGGRKIFEANEEASPAIWKQKGEVTIKTNDTDVIRRIVIRDLRPDKDGEAKITDGGQGQKNVTVELKSPTILRGYYFHIEVYAVKENGEEEVNTEVPVTEIDTVSTEQVPVRAINTEVNTATKEAEGIVTSEYVPEVKTEGKVIKQTVVAPIISGRPTRSISPVDLHESDEDGSDEDESDEDESDVHSTHIHPYFSWKQEQDTKHTHNSHEVKTVPANTDTTKKGPSSHVVKVVPTASTNPQEVNGVSTTVLSVSTTLASTDSTTLASAGSTTLASADSTTLVSADSTILASADSPVPTSTAIPAKATESATESEKLNTKPFQNISKELGQRIVFGIKNV